MTGKTIHLLLIEDDDADALMIRETLSNVREVHYKISRVPALGKGITMCRNTDIDVVLLDLNLPDAQGLDTIKTFLEEGFQVPVIVLTGLEDGKAACRAIELGVQNYLFKGRIDPDALSRVVLGAIKRVKTDTQIKESEQKFRLLFNKNADGMIIVDVQGKILFMNPAAESLFKRPKEELIGNGFGFPVETEIVSEMDVFRPDGTLAVAEIRSNPIIWEKADAFLLTLRDMTDRKRLEEELARARQMEALGILAGGVAHDFNNILTIIFGFTDLCLSTAPKKEHKENLEEIRKAVKRGRDTVSRILAFTRQARETRQQLRMSPIIRETLKFIRQTLPTTIDVHQEVKSRASIMGDPVQVHKIFMNLCTNAVHAMETQGGLLTVRLNDVLVSADGGTATDGLKPGKYIVLEVSDTGTGMPPHVMKKVFEPYFTTKEVGKGSGLGLAVVHGTVKKYKGCIKVSSTPGEGTCFSVYLPALEGAPGNGPMPGGKGHILFVDEHEEFMEINERLLSLMDYTVTPQTDRIAAMENFRRHPDGFDLAIIDVSMPELAEDMVRARPDIPILQYGKVVEKEGFYLTFHNTPPTGGGISKAVRRLLEFNINSSGTYNI